MNNTGTRLARGWPGVAPGGTGHGQAAAAGRTLGESRTAAPAAEAPAGHLPGPEAARPPAGPDRHPVRAADRPALERPAPGDGLRLRQPLPPLPPGVVPGRRLAPPARGAAGRVARGGPDRLVAGGRR